MTNNYKNLSIERLSKILLHDGTDRAAQRELQRKMKAAVKKAKPVDFGRFRGPRKTLRNIDNIVEDMILDDEVNQ